MNGIGVSAVNAHTRLIGNGRHAHRTNGTPVFTLSTRRPAHGASAPKSAPSRPSHVRTEAVGADALALRDTSGRQAALTNWSFEQLAGIAGAPPNYLRTLPAAIASGCDQLRAAPSTS